MQMRTQCRQHAERTAMAAFRAPGRLVQGLLLVGIRQTTAQPAEANESREELANTVCGPTVLHLSANTYSTGMIYQDAETTTGVLLAQAGAHGRQLCTAGTVGGRKWRTAA